jgi:parallel beta-helix repeat protein
VIGPDVAGFVRYGGGVLLVLGGLLQASAGSPAPAPTPLAASCPASLQDAIDATPTGGTLRLGECTFHEAVTVGRGMTITGPGVIDGDGIRDHWMTVTAPDVTVDGLSMRNAAAGGYQSGSLDVDGAARFTLRGASLSGGSYADLRLWNGSGHTIEDSTFTAGRAIAIVGWNVTDSTISGNRLTGNNTTGADPGNEAGGIKLGQSSDVTISDNEVGDNDGVGIWCDVGCAGVTISGNRVHDNTHQGILYEISSGGSITGNAAWENGWHHTAWGWGGGIVVSSSGTTDVADNTVAWNADGITVLSQDRSGAPAMTGNRVDDNVIAIAPQPGDDGDAYALGWLDDWSSSLFAPGSGNGGAGNAVTLVAADGDRAFAWAGDYTDPAGFAATPGGTGLVVLDPAAAGDRLAAAGVPGSPVALVVQSNGSRRQAALRILVPVAVGVVLLAGLAVAVRVLRRRRRRAGPAAPSPTP